MSFTIKGEDGGQVLVESLSMEGASLSEGLSTNDFHTLSQLSQELNLNADMETDEVLVEGDNYVDVPEEVIIESTDLGAEEEIEIESEEASASSAPITIATVAEDTKKVPPLRPLTIAPKPAKIPVTMKTLGGGQQLLLLPGSGQAIKLVSPQGQELNLAGLTAHTAKPLTIRPAIKTVSAQGNVSLVQQKPVVMKKIITQTHKIQKPVQKQGQQQFVVVQKAGGAEVQQQVKLIQTMPSPTKTITLQQAQEMGLLAPKIVPQAAKQTVLINKSPQKTIKLVPQGQLVAGQKAISLNQLKSPTKILPATSFTAGKAQQRIVFKTAGSGQAVLPQGQLIQLTGGGQAINSGQLHQINIPGKGMQYIKFVTTSTAEAAATTVKTATQVAGGTVVLSELKPVIAPKTIKTTKFTTTPTQQPVVLTYSLPQGAVNTANKVAIPSKPAPAPPMTPKTESQQSQTTDAAADANGIRPRKPCNCTKSQCLKLYCDCFANGEFCYMCNCTNCYNNLENEDHRQRAIKTCLERNPQAFKPKIGKAKDTTGDTAVRKHTKGCNCKRSGCLKNYCECYEAKIACSNNCKCVGCRNIEDTMEKKNIRMTTMENALMSPQSAGKTPPSKDSLPPRTRRTSATTKAPISFITDDVIEATFQCMKSISDGAEDADDVEGLKTQIIEEFGRCLVEIIECSADRN